MIFVIVVVLAMSKATLPTLESEKYYNPDCYEQELSNLGVR